jgi:uracil-DNA glycosylase
LQPKAIQTMDVKIEESWKELLKEEFSKSYFLQIAAHLKAEKATGATVYPPGQLIFHAFEKTPFSKLKVVIIGQDPYHGPGQAHGLSFSVPEGTPFPPSLQNISKELETDIGQGLRSGDLAYWAKQGVLLLNSSLTVRAHEAGSHGKMGWMAFTKDILRVLQGEKEHVVVLLWGNHAASFAPLFDLKRHFVIKSAHPSPLSANRGGWFGKKPFSRTNTILKDFGLEPIQWV